MSVKSSVVPFMVGLGTITKAVSISLSGTAMPRGLHAASKATISNGTKAVRVMVLKNGGAATLKGCIQSLGEIGFTRIERQTAVIRIGGRVGKTCGPFV